MKTSEVIKLYMHSHADNLNSITSYIRRNVDNPEKIAHFISLIYRVKMKGGNSGQYGYYLSQGHAATDLLDILRRYKIKSFVDLGAGVGDLLTIFGHLGYMTWGIENEESLVEIAHGCGRGSIVKGDITEPFELRRAGEAVYFYEPLALPQLVDKFVKNLENCLPKDTLIIYNSAGHIYETLKKSTAFKAISYKKGRSQLKLFRKL